MKFFNIDFHISVIADVKNLFESLGHSVDRVCLSAHAKHMGIAQEVVPEFRTPNEINEGTCESFYARNKDILAGYDGFIVTHTPSLIGVYEATGKPVICVVSTRFDNCCTDKVRRVWLISTMRRMHATGQLTLVANNAYDQWHTERHTGLKPTLISSVCEYTKAKWQGGAEAPFFHGKTQPPSGLKHLPPNHAWSDVAERGACVCIPYNVSLMSLFERHSMGLPVILPSQKWLQKHPQSLSELHTNSAVFSRFDHWQASVLADWITGELEGVTLFDDVAEVPKLLKTAKPTTGQHSRKEKAMTRWTSVLDDLATQRPSNNWSGNPAGRWRWAENFFGDFHENGTFVQTDELLYSTKLGTWSVSGRTISLDLSPHWKMRIEMEDDGSGVWFLNQEITPSGVFIRENDATKPIQRRFLCLDNHMREEGAVQMHPYWVPEWHKHVKPSEPYTLVTGFSDAPIDSRFLRVLDDPNLVCWYGQNVEIEHPKLKPIPMGVSGGFVVRDVYRSKISSTRPWQYDQMLADCISADHPKVRDFHVSFNPETNKKGERHRCLQAIGLPNERCHIEEYLAKLAASRFCISPDGNGTDCLRVWESLYLKTVPIITRNHMVEQGLYSDLPVIVLDKWGDFKKEDFTPWLYQTMMADFLPDKLSLDVWTKGASLSLLKPFEEVRDRLVAEFDSCLWTNKLLHDYGSHIVPLSMICETLMSKGALGRVLEVGGGCWSTPLLLSTRAKVHTIEQGQNVSAERNAQWAKQLGMAYGCRSNWTYEVRPRPQGILQPSGITDIDLAFVDGDAAGRLPMVQEMIYARTPTILAHDSQNPGFKYAHVQAGPEWAVFDFRGNPTWTRIWTIDPDVLAIMGADERFVRL